MKRRRFLRGMGAVAVGLPFLEALDGREANADNGGYSPYAVFIREANGFAQATADEPERFFPSQTGAITKASLDAEPDRTVSVLSDYASKMTILRGVSWPFPGNGCGHSGGGNQVLTAARLSADFQSNESLPTGESIDSFIARQLHPGVEPLTLLSGPSSGYLNEVLSYTNVKVAGSDANQIRPAEHSPHNAYMDLFGLSALEPEVLERLKQQRKSVNDIVRADMQRLMARTDLSKDDRSRLEVHFDAIRDLEITMTCSLGDPEIAAMQAIQGDLDNPDGDFVIAMTKMHMDVMALAFACGAVRVGTLQIGHGNDHTEYWIFGERQQPFHWISHRISGDGADGSAPPIDGADVLHAEIDRIHADMVKYLCDRLSQYTIGSGTLLDSGLVVFTNDLSNKYHGYNNVPHVIIGSANDYIKTGHYLDAGDVTNNKLLNTIGAALGVVNASGGPLDDFGDASLEKGLITGMLA
jgi:hypothetical protein